MSFSDVVRFTVRAFENIRIYGGAQEKKELFDVFGENSQNATRLVPRKCNQQDRVNRKTYKLCTNALCDEPKKEKACALLHMFGVRACATFVCMPLTDEIALISVHKHVGPGHMTYLQRSERIVSHAISSC